MIGVNQAEGVAGIAVHVAVAIGGAAVGKKNRDLMQRFRGERPEVPHHRRRAQIRLRNALLRVYEITEFQGVAHKEEGVLLPVMSQLPSSV